MVCVACVDRSQIWQLPLLDTTATMTGVRTHRVGYVLSDVRFGGRIRVGGDVVRRWTRTVSPTTDARVEVEAQNEVVDPPPGISSNLVGRPCRKERRREMMFS